MLTWKNTSSIFGCRSRIDRQGQGMLVNPTTPLRQLSLEISTARVFPELCCPGHTCINKVG